MVQKDTLPGDLLACVAAALAALLLTTGSAESLFSISAYAALALAFFLPGYALSVAVFPGRNDLEDRSRAALILLFSATSAFLLGLFLNFIGHLNAASLSQLLVFLAAAAIAVAHLHRSSLPRSRRFSPGQRRNLRSTWKMQPSKALPGSGAVLPLILVALVLIAAAVGLGHFMHPQSENGFTEFVVDGSEEGSSPLQAVAGQARESLVRIVNHEGRSEDYTLLLLSNGRKVWSDQLELDDGEQWNRSVSYTLQEPGISQVLDFLLYRSGNSTSPYLSQRLLFDVGSPERTLESANASNETEASQATLAGDSAASSTPAPVVLASTSSSGSSSSGSSGSSSGSTSRSTTKPASASAGSEESTAAESYVSEPLPQAEDGAYDLSGQDDQLDDQPDGQSDGQSDDRSDSQSPAEASATSEAAGEEGLTAPSESDAGPKGAVSAPSIPTIVPLRKIEELEASLNSSLEASLRNEGQVDGVAEDLPEDETLGAPSEPEETAAEPLASEPSKPENDSSISKAAEPALIDVNSSVLAAEDESSDNRVPQITDLYSDRPSPQPQGTTVIWTAKADDPEDDALNYKFYLDGKAVTSWTRSNTWNWLSTGSPAGEHLISVWVRDGNHADKKGCDCFMNRTFSLRSPNEMPALIDLLPDKSSPQPAGGSITWRVNARDPEEDQILYRFFLNGQAVTEWQKSGIWIWPTSGLPSGDYQVKVWIRDGMHAAADRFDASKEALFSLADSNSVPSLNSFSPDLPDPQTPGSVVTWTAVATDPEGDPVLYRFLINDAAATAWSGSGSWSWNTTGMQDGNYKIGVQVRDGLHGDSEKADGSMDFTYTLQSSNQKPAISSLEADKSSPQAQGAEIAWTAEVSDPEGDPVLVRFLLNGRPQTGWSRSTTWTWDTGDLTEGTYRIGVSARDGLHADSEGYDNYWETPFVLRSAIDQQIDELMSTRGQNKASYQSTDIALSADNDTTVYAVLGKTRDDSSQNTGVRDTYRVGD